MSRLKRQAEALIPGLGRLVNVVRSLDPRLRTTCPTASHRPPDQLGFRLQFVLRLFISVKLAVNSNHTGFYERKFPSTSSHRA
jgi:hypothetical protein